MQAETESMPANEQRNGRNAVVLARFAPGIFLILWASGFAFAKLGLKHAQPLTFLSLRFSVVIVVFAVLFLVMKPGVPKKPSDWLHIAVVGFLIQSVYFGMAYAGMNLGVSAGIAALIASMQPLIVALAAPWSIGERITAKKWLGLLTGAIGAAIVIAADASFEARLDYGLVLCVLSMLGMAAATLYQKRFSVNAHPVTVNLVQYVVGFVTVAPLALTFEKTGIDWTFERVGSLLFLVVANSIVAVSLLLFMIGRSQVSRVSALFFLVPPVAAIFSWLLLGETLTTVAFLGMAVASIGVYIVSTAR
jgi:drug/metabolite transporter (DMT)-like permease